MTTFAAAQLLRVLPRTRLSRAVGRLCDQQLHPWVSKAIAGAYCRVYDVNMREVLPQVGQYASFDAFFTRALREGVRPISHAPVVSPADGRLRAAGDIDDQARLFVKGQEYEVGELLGDSSEAARYGGGCFAVVYLHPRDYHRVHSPVDGAITLVRGVPGDLFPVNAIGEQHVPRLLSRNNRVVIVIDSPELGRVSVVMVGAVIVGRISVAALPVPAPPPGAHRIHPPIPVAKGDEIGAFHLGSTVVLLLEQSLRLRRAPDTVRYGQSLIVS